MSSNVNNFVDIQLVSYHNLNVTYYDPQKRIIFWGHLVLKFRIQRNLITL